MARRSKQEDVVIRRHVFHCVILCGKRRDDIRVFIVMCSKNLRNMHLFCCKYILFRYKKKKIRQKKIRFLKKQKMYLHPIENVYITRFVFISGLDFRLNRHSFFFFNILRSDSDVYKNVGTIRCFFF